MSFSSLAYVFGLALPRLLSSGFYNCRAGPQMSVTSLSRDVCAWGDGPGQRGECGCGGRVARSDIPTVAFGAGPAAVTEDNARNEREKLDSAGKFITRE